MKALLALTLFVAAAVFSSAATASLQPVPQNTDQARAAYRVPANPTRPACPTAVPKSTDEARRLNLICK